MSLRKIKKALLFIISFCMVSIYSMNSISILAANDPAAPLTEEIINVEQPQIKMNAENPDDAAERNLVAGMAATCSSAPGCGGNFGGIAALTNGVYANSAFDSYDPQWAYWSGSLLRDVSITFNLQEKKSVSSILIGTMIEEITNPNIKNIQVSVSDDGENWAVLKDFKDNVAGKALYIWNGKTDKYVADAENANMVYCQYVKIKFDIGPGLWAYIDEIEINGKDGKCSTAGTLIQQKNLALRKPYTVDYFAHSSYPDDEDTKLTDGVMDDGSWNKAAGFSGEFPSRSVVVDLGEDKSISKIQGHFIHYPSYAVNYPSGLIVSVSQDKANWSTLYYNNKSETGGANEKKWLGWDGQNIDSNTVSVADFVYARYAKIEFVLDGWGMLDEIEVYGVDGKIDRAQVLPADSNLLGEYMKPGSHTAGIHDMILAYNSPYKDYAGKDGYGNWSKDDFKPYVTYIDKNGKSIDTMFDAVLFLALSSEDGSQFIDTERRGASDKVDWDWYLNKTFGINGDVYSLNEAAKQAAIDLRDETLKTKVVVMVPFPDDNQAKFGEINGEMLNLKNDEHAKKALDWYIGEVMNRWTAANYSHLELAGFYWMHETPYRSNLIQYVSQKVAAELNKKLFWIPYFDTNWSKWNNYGINGITLQPNHFFTSDTEPSLKRMKEAAHFAKMFGMGMEIEMDERSFTDVNRYNRYLDYLNGSVEFGYAGENTCFRNWYNGIKTLMEAAYGNNTLAKSNNPQVRALYDYTYKVIKGTYSKTDYITKIEDGSINKPEEPAPVPVPTPVPIQPTLPAKTDIEVLVNGKGENVGAANSTKEGDKTVVTVVLDEKKLGQNLEKESGKAVVGILVTAKADIVRYELNGQMVRSMEDKHAVLEVRTGTATYTLPADQIDIEAVSEKIGNNVELKDIKLRMEISKPAEETIKLAESLAKKGEYAIVAPPVEFSLKCINGDKVVEISKFNCYVERKIAIPSDITTGVLLNSDGTLSHVPTKIVIIDGKCYARINSLTNSIYSAVSSPKNFKDIESHWAKNIINDMGSRLVMYGIEKDKFGPDLAITRAEFVDALIRGLGLMSSGKKTDQFKDVKDGNKYMASIAAAVEYGIIGGYKDGTYRPGNLISRQEAMNVLVRAMKIAGIDTNISDAEIETVLGKYTDKDKIHKIAVKSVAICIRNGILVGGNKTIVPGENITRAQTAVVVSRLLEKAKLI